MLGPASTQSTPSTSGSGSPSSLSPSRASASSSSPPAFSASSVLSHGPTVAAFYMLTAILLIYFNKAAFSYYDFDAPNLLTLSQAACSLLLLSTIRSYKLIAYQDFSWSNARKLAPIALSFLAYMVLGMLALKLVSVPMYTTLRRTTVVFVMALDYYTARRGSSTAVKLSVALMVLGALIAGWRDLRFDLLSYAIVFLYNLFTALYLVLVNAITARERAVAEHEHVQPLDKYDLQLYNNLINIPLLLVLILATGETRSLLSSPYLQHVGFHLSLLASSLLAFLLNVAIFANTAVNSALTQTVSGQAKDAVVVVLGALAFEDGGMDAGGAVGVTLGFIGSVAYAVAKMRQAAPTAAAAAAGASKASGGQAGEVRLNGATRGERTESGRLLTVKQDDQQQTSSDWRSSAARWSPHRQASARRLSMSGQTAASNSGNTH